MLLILARSLKCSSLYRNAGILLNEGRTPGYSLPKTRNIVPPNMFRRFVGKCYSKDVSTKYVEPNLVFCCCDRRTNGHNEGALGLLVLNN